MKPEARISKDIREVMGQAGFVSWSLEQGYRKEAGGTRQSPGVPDLIFAGHGRTLWVEVKTEKGRLTIHQKYFADRWISNGGTCLVWRSPGDAFDWLCDVGIVTEGGS